LIVSELPFPNFFPHLHTSVPFFFLPSLLENPDLTERIDRGRGASGHPHLGGLREVYMCVGVYKCTPAHCHLLGANVTDCSWLHRLAHAPSLMRIIALPLSGAETNSHCQSLVLFFFSLLSLVLSLPLIQTAEQAKRTQPNYSGREKLHFSVISADRLITKLHANMV